MAQTGLAQPVTTKPSNAAGEFSVKFSPLAVADIFDGNLSAGAEYRLSNKWSVNMEAGWIFYSLYAQRTRRTNGIILRPSIRLYLGQSELFFLELQGHYKYVSYDIKDTLFYDASGSTPAYGLDTTFKFNRKVLGFHFTGGIKVPLTNDRRLSMEFYLGLGMHYKWQTYFRHPKSVYRAEDKNRIIRIHDMNGAGGIAFPAGIRFVYRIR
jgi:hypothetical protein